MKSKSTIVLLLMFLSLNVFSQKTTTEKKEQLFETIDPNENERPNQFLTNFLRTHKRFRLNKNVKQGLANPVGGAYTSRKVLDNGYSSSSITRIFMDNEEILGEGINRIYTIENTRTKDIDKITRSSVGYDNEIRIYSKK